MKAVFDAKAGSPYKDDVATRYHFPKRLYMDEMARIRGDWVVYREPRENGGSMAYFGTARVRDIVDDPLDPTHAYVLMADYLPFDPVVPFRTAGLYEEAKLRAMPVKAGVGAALRGRSVRPLADADFAAIVLRGLGETLAPGNVRRLGTEEGDLRDASEAASEGDAEERARRVATLLVNRRVRDASFRGTVLAAYDDTCAVTGLRIVNGGGRAEAQAAHIVPVADGGIDVVQNGIALCGTAHWLFDRHLISIGEDFGLLVAHNRLPEGMRGTFLPCEGRLILPKDERLWPAPRFAEWHRERFALS